MSEGAGGDDEVSLGDQDLGDNVSVHEAPLIIGSTGEIFEVNVFIF